MSSESHLGSISNLVEVGTEIQLHDISPCETVRGAINGERLANFKELKNIKLNVQAVSQKGVSDYRYSYTHVSVIDLAVEHLTLFWKGTKEPLSLR